MDVAVISIPAETDHGGATCWSIMLYNKEAHTNSSMAIRIVQQHFFQTSLKYNTALQNQAYIFFWFYKNVICVIWCGLITEIMVCLKHLMYYILLWYVSLRFLGDTA